MYSAIAGDVYQPDGRVGYDVVIMAAAVADYRPAVVANEKIKKGASERTLELTATIDIVSSLGKERRGSDSPMLVGFAVETGSAAKLLEEARSKLERKNLDFVVGNLAEDSFDKDTNRVCIVSRDGAVQQLDTTSKQRVACRILDEISQALEKQGKIVQAVAQ
jgi:phosphopantothenoylcysteine decarboxylase/phosphopantothenate--cysteine ligase